MTTGRDARAVVLLLILGTVPAGAVPPGRPLSLFSSSRSFFGEPLEERLTYKELSRRLAGPGNGLGDIYRVDFTALGIEK